MKKFSSLILVVFAVCFSGITIGYGQKMNAISKKLASKLPKTNIKGGGNAKQAGNAVVKVFSAMKSIPASTSGKIDAVRRAYTLRKDIGAVERNANLRAIADAWEAAEAHGAIARGSGFFWRATQGRYDGEALLFENIVPAETAPEFAGYVANIRLVPQSRARKKGAPLTAREQSHLNVLKNIKQEIEGRRGMMKTTGVQDSKAGNSMEIYLAPIVVLENGKVIRKPLDSAGLNAEQARAKYNQELEIAGDRVNSEPRIRLRGQRLSTPSNMSNNRYRVLFEATNISSHPTEIDLVFTIIGYIEKDKTNPIYRMNRVQQTWKLRQNEARRIEIWASGPKLSYRGYTVVANFRGQNVEVLGSDGRLQSAAENGNIFSPPPKGRK